MDKQRREAKEMTKQLKGKEKWINFWYYHKIHIITLVFVVAVLSVILTEYINKIEYDLNIACYTSTYIDDSKTHLLINEFANNIDDIDGNGETNADIVVNIGDPYGPSEQSQAVFIKLTSELSGGNAFGYILDETFYQMFTKNYADCIDSSIRIDSIPLIKETLKLKDDQKLYWVTKSVYLHEKDIPIKLSEHKNSVKIQEYLSSLIK